MKQFEIKEDTIDIFDKRIANRMNIPIQYKAKGHVFNAPKTIGTLRELFYLTTDQSVLKEGRELLKELKLLRAIKRTGTQDCWYTPKKITMELCNNDENLFNRLKLISENNKKGYLALTEKQNSDVYFGIKTMDTYGFVFYFDEPRTGKISKTIALADAIKAEKIIVVNLITALNKFKKEFKLWQHVDREVIVIDGKTAQQRKEIWKRFFDTDDKMVIISSYETIKADENEWNWRACDLLICNEPHMKMKNYQRGNYQAIKKISQMAIRKILLTATTLDDWVTDAYVYLSIAFPDMFKSRWVFLCRYFEQLYDPITRTKEKVGGWNFRKYEIIELLNSCATNRKDQQKRPIPKLIDIPLSQEQRAFMAKLDVYGEFKMDFPIEIEKIERNSNGDKVKRTITSQYRSVDEITKAGFKRRAAVGIYANRGFNAKNPSPKLKYVLDYINRNSSKQILVFTDHTHFIKESEKFLKGIKYKIFSGENSTKQKEKIKIDFNNVDIQLVLANTNTISNGGTYENADSIFFLNLSFNHKDFKRACDRLIHFKDQFNEGDKIFILMHEDTEDIEDYKRTLDKKIPLTK